MIIFIGACDVSSEAGLFNNSSEQCQGANCNSSTGVDYLKIRPNYKDPFTVNPSAVRVNIGGDCNEGGFKENIITWKLFQGQNLKTTSDAAFANTNGMNTAYLASCKNGRFTLLVDIEYKYPSFSNPVPGLRVPNENCESRPCYEAHDLHIEFFGLDENGDRIKNPSTAAETIRLVPYSFIQ